MNNVLLVDYGLGNLFNVKRALEHCGARVHVSANPDEIAHAGKILLPGVGAFADGMREIRRLGIDQALRHAAATGSPLLGICLGMQMLLDESEEYGSSEGLGLISGKVAAIPQTDSDGQALKIPHIGWNELVMPKGRTCWTGSLLSTTAPGTAFYFVHSFMAQPSSPSHRVADCHYGHHAVSAMIARDNVMGCQFHPEKSGEAGLSILRRFIAQ